MKRILLFVATAAVLFGASAAASWKWQQTKLAHAGGDESSEGDSTESHGEAKAGKNESSGGNSAESAAKPKATQPSGKPASGDAARTRVGVRPAYTGGVDDAVQIAASLRDRMNVVKEREAQMAARQTQIQLIYDDIRGERSAIDELRKQIEEELKAVEAQLAAAEQRQAEIEQREQDMKGRVTEMEGDEKDNIKKMAGMYDTMPPEGAAKILQEMADSGNMDTAVKLLATMKERQAAKVLAELTDTALAAQLSEKLTTLKRPTATVKK